MEARKLNKVYQIDKSEAERYAAMGYEVYDGKKLVRHAKGASVPIEEHEAVKAELETAKARARAAKA